MDERDRALYDEKIRHLEERITRMESGELECKREIFPRITALELWMAGSVASSWKGAFVIAGASVTGGIVVTLLNHFLRIH